MFIFLYSINPLSSERDQYQVEPTLPPFKQMREQAIDQYEKYFNFIC